MEGVPLMHLYNSLRWVITALGPAPEEYTAAGLLELDLSSCPTLPTPLAHMPHPTAPLGWGGVAWANKSPE